MANATAQNEARQKNPSVEEPMQQFRSRESSELVIGFAGPIGCDIKKVADLVEEILAEQGYTVYRIKISKLLTGATNESANIAALSTENSRRYYDLQSAGNKYREKYAKDFLAQYAAKEIALIRESFSALDANKIPLSLQNLNKRTVFLIEQLKHQDEVQLLRTVYRQNFYLIGATSVSDNRLSHLKKTMSEDAARLLMKRDKSDKEKSGQQIAKTLHLADFFVRSDRGSAETLKAALRRFFELVHGKALSPKTQEYAMYLAYASGLRSACLSRQVGAAIVDRSGNVIGTGRNDVPRAGGGLYGSDNGLSDFRCDTHLGECSNVTRKLRLKEQIKSELNDMLEEGVIKFPDKNSNSDIEIISKANRNETPTIDPVIKIVDRLFSQSGIPDLIEFSRAVHAEMDALISIARQGSNSVRGGSLYSTTFPCHSCARHIVAAGISKVYYIEPYEKSLAQELHGDSIEFDADDASEEIQKLPIEKVKFVHYEGVAPRRYAHMFSQNTERKDDYGKSIPVRAYDSKKKIPEYLDSFSDFEARVVDHYQQLLKESPLNGGISETPLWVHPV